MNIALPAFVVFFLLLPGFLFRSRFKRFERISVDYSPFGQVVSEGVLWSTFFHAIWLALAYLFFSQILSVSSLLGLISSNNASQAEAIKAIEQDIAWIGGYFLSLFAAAFLLPTIARAIVGRFKLDRAGARFSAWFRFHQAPWYYLLTGADFKKEEEPDYISISAIVDVAGQAFLYTGVLDEFFVGEDGQLDRLVLREVMRRPLASDKSAAQADTGGLDPARFYAVDGDYFVLRYAEAITLNVQYNKLTPEISGEVTADVEGITPDGALALSHDVSDIG